MWLVLKLTLIESIISKTKHYIPFQFSVCGLAGHKCHDDFRYLSSEYFIKLIKKKKKEACITLMMVERR